MKVLLMHRDRDFDPRQGLPWNAGALTQDLELETLFRAMAGDDQFLLDVARTALLCGWQNDVEAIRYRQDVVKDCLNNPGVVRELYDLAVEAIERKRRSYFGVLSRYPGSILSGASEVMRIFAEILGRLRRVADEHAGRFESEGFRSFFAMLARELNDDYLASIERHLAELQFRRGVLLSAEVGKGSEVANCVLRKAHGRRQSWLMRMLGRGPPGHTVVIAERDEAGARYLSELRDRGINLVANALAQSTDHILGFFEILRAELAFYVGCVNLHGRLRSLGQPTCFPRPHPARERKLRCDGLSDACLALTMGRAVVGNTVDADGKCLVIVTGANQGGKSTFLRSVGLAQLMMQSGMFVSGEVFDASLCDALFTHYKREEDTTMKSGKLDEELGRMSGIVERLARDSMVLFNESFAATNEREGSEIARQVVLALLEKRIRVLFVTHLYEFAHGLSDGGRDDFLFVRAERKADGSRTFRVVEGQPLETSFGEDLYREVFAAGTDVASVG